MKSIGTSYMLFYYKLMKRLYIRDYYFKPQVNGVGHTFPMPDVGILTILSLLDG